MISAGLHVEQLLISRKKIREIYWIPLNMKQTLSQLPYSFHPNPPRRSYNKWNFFNGNGTGVKTECLLFRK